jgi:hypothetical protein
MVERYLNRLLARLVRDIGPDAAREHVAEIRSHIEMSMAEGTAQGMTEKEATFSALRRLGRPAGLARALAHAHRAAGARWRWAVVLGGVFFSAAASILLSQAVWMATGGSGAFVALPVTWLILIAFQMACNGLGLLFRRVVLVGLILAVLFVAIQCRYLPPPGTEALWLRHVVYDVFLPVPNAIFLALFLKRIDRARGWAVR